MRLTDRMMDAKTPIEWVTASCVVDRTEATYGKQCAVTVTAYGPEPRAGLTPDQAN